MSQRGAAGGLGRPHPFCVTGLKEGAEGRAAAARLGGSYQEWRGLVIVGGEGGAEERTAGAAGSQVVLRQVSSCGPGASCLTAVEPCMEICGQMKVFKVIDFD